jgi:hypothetical protein
MHHCQDLRAETLAGSKFHRIFSIVIVSNIR